MATERSKRVSADEARDLLARFARARQTGNAADVWGPLDRMEALAHTVIARDAEVAELRAELARERAEHDHTCKALGVELQYTQERVAELHDTLRATARACTLPEDTAPAALPAQVEACIRDLSRQIEGLTLAAQEPNHHDTTEGDGEFDHV